MPGGAERALAKRQPGKSSSHAKVIGWIRRAAPHRGPGTALGAPHPPARVTVALIGAPNPAAQIRSRSSQLDTGLPSVARLVLPHRKWACPSLALPIVGRRRQGAAAGGADRPRRRPIRRVHSGGRSMDALTRRSRGLRTQSALAGLLLALGTGMAAIDAAAHACPWPPCPPGSCRASPRPSSSGMPLAQCSGMLRSPPIAVPGRERHTIAPSGTDLRA